MADKLSKAISQGRAKISAMDWKAQWLRAGIADLADVSQEWAEFARTSLEADALCADERREAEVVRVDRLMSWRRLRGATFLNFDDFDTGRERLDAIHAAAHGGLKIIDSLGRSRGLGTDGIPGKNWPVVICSKAEWLRLRLETSP